MWYDIQKLVKRGSLPSERLYAVITDYYFTILNGDWYLIDVSELTTVGHEA
jgi:hypothetical protein